MESYHDRFERAVTKDRLPELEAYALVGELNEMSVPQIEDDAVHWNHVANERQLAAVSELSNIAGYGDVRAVEVHSILSRDMADVSGDEVIWQAATIELAYETMRLTYGLYEELNAPIEKEVYAPIEKRIVVARSAVGGVDALSHVDDAQQLALIAAVQTVEQRDLMFVTGILYQMRPV